MKRFAITDAEFKQRQAKVKAAAKNAGLDALLIWSRGGNSVEAYGDVFYLSNFQSPFPLVSDTSAWMNRGHAAIVMPVDGDPVLITDWLEGPTERIKISDVRIKLDLPTATVDVLRELGLLDLRLGLVGRMSMLYTAMEEMKRAAPGLQFVQSDNILQEARLVKSSAELDCLRHAADVGIAWMNATMDAMVEGRTEAEAAGEGLRVLASLGGVQQDIGIASGRNSANLFGNYSVPHWNPHKKFETGDLAHADLWGPVDGYYTDFARSTVVGGKPSAAQMEVLEGSIDIIETIIRKIKPGVTFGELYAVGNKWLEDNRYLERPANSSEGGSFAVQFPCFGHTLGVGIDGPYIVENDPTVIQENMVLAIEALVARPGVGGAEFEQNLIVRADGVEIMTARCPSRRW